MTQAFFDYRFASGHVSYATITGSSSYILRNFTRATDQPLDLEWYIAETPPIDDAAFFSGSLSGNTGGNGLPFIDLYLSGVTPGMVAYWNTTFLGAEQSAAITFLIPDRRLLAANAAKVYQATIHKTRHADINKWQAYGDTYLSPRYKVRLTKLVYQAPP